MSSRSRAICSVVVSASLRCRASAGLALLEVRGVAALERRQLPVAQLPDAGHDGVQERPVVGRDEQRALASGEVRLQPLERGEVQVVGGLVEQQQVRVVDQQPGQRDPRLLATRQRQGRALPVLPRHAQPGQRLLHPLVDVVAAEVVEPLPQAGVLPGLDGTGARRLQLRELQLQPLHLRGTRPHGPQDGRASRRMPRPGSTPGPACPRGCPPRCGSCRGRDRRGH